MVLIWSSFYTNSSFSIFARTVTGFGFYQVRAFVFSSITFSLASPLGVAVGQCYSWFLAWTETFLSGIGLSGLPPSIPQQICNGVLQVQLFSSILPVPSFSTHPWKLQGIAGGTFLYITFFEVLPHELNIPSKRLWKVSILLIVPLCASMVPITFVQVFFVILGFAVFCVTLFGHGQAHGHAHQHAHQLQNEM